MASILITGGTGYIGSHTVVELLANNHDVLIVDNLSNSEASVVDGIKAITGTDVPLEVLDLCDLDKLRSFCQERAPIDAIIHFAASKAVAESIAQPILYYRNNLVSMLNVLQCMDEFDIQHLVFSSSCTVYGNPKTLPVTEDAPVTRPEAPYGNTKKICEEIIEDTMKAKNQMSAISLRYFNPIGAHPSTLIGEKPTGIPDNLMPFITQVASGQRDKLKIFGNDYDTPDGTCIRDYIHVVDLAIAHVKALDRMREGRSKQRNETFNVGTGTGYTVLDVINSFERVSGLKLNFEIVDRRPGDVEKIYASTHLANQELEWKATRTLDQMTQSAWEWQQRVSQ